MSTLAAIYAAIGFMAFGWMAGALKTRSWVEVVMAAWCATVWPLTWLAIALCGGPRSEAEAADVD